MSRGTTARLFVAIDPPRVVCEEIAAWARSAIAARSIPDPPLRARAARLLAPEAMHVTVCFLGSRAVEEIETVASALQRCIVPGGELSLGAPLWLPPKRPHALALAVHDRNGELARIHEAARDALCDAIAWQPERRRFRAHVTVARIGRERSRRRRRDDQCEPVLPPTPSLCFEAAEIVLYRSHLAPTGASYERLETRSLSPSSDTSPGDEAVSGAAPSPDR